ncbi:MAG TPA: tetratricopeptide repeat protein [Thermoanaerobaculia bacterium]
MKSLLVAAAIVALTLTGCTSSGNDASLYESPFYARYLDTGSTLDSQILWTLEALRNDPASPALHNDLGSLLVRKGFPKDAEREFERAIDLDGRFHPAWYNLGMVRAARGSESGARRAFRRTVSLKPGHAPALFQLGLVEEKNDNFERAIDFYAKAYSINPSLLEVEVNPRVLDSKLTHRALLRLYPTKHTRDSMQLENAPDRESWTQRRQGRQQQQAPSPQAAPQNIVSPSPPATEQGTQGSTPPNPN